MPNMLPRVSGGRRANVFYNTGHGHLGWTLSAATAQIVAGLVDARLRSVSGTIAVPGGAVEQAG